MPELMRHQADGVSWLKTRDRALLADEPGLGKSVQSLLAATEPILVTAPAMVLDSGVWDDEIAKWAPGADVTQVAYSSMCEREKTEKGGTRPTDRLRPDLRRRWGTWIADEAHYLKGRKTLWTLASGRIRADRLTEATGTPIPNWADEAWMLLKLIYPGDKRFSSYWRWAREWFDVGPTVWSPMAVGKLRADRTWESFREENWGDRMLLRLRDDCLDLPPYTERVWKAKATAAQMKVYRALKKDFVAWLDSGEEVAAWNSAAQLVKLCKAATGLEVLERGAGQSGKLDALASILEDRPLPTLVVAHFRDSVEACARVAERVGSSAKVVHGGTPRAERKLAVRAFQRGELQVLAASIDVVAEGVTMVAGDQVVRVERSWRPSRNQQVARRIHRIGQTRPVTVIDLVTPDTVDEHVMRMLAQKTDQQIKALGVGELRGMAA